MGIYDIRNPLSPLSPASPVWIGREDGTPGHRTHIPEEIANRAMTDALLMIAGGLLIVMLTITVTYWLGTLFGKDSSFNKPCK